MLTVPAFLSGCASTSILSPTVAVPENPFLQWFGIDRQSIGSVMSELTAGGADHAELYFQYRRTSTMVLADGTSGVSNIIIIQGLGLRVIRDGQTGFAFTENLDLKAMLTAARTAAAIAAGPPAALPDFAAPVAAGTLYQINKPWSDVPDQRRSGILQDVDAQVRLADPTASQVVVELTDTDERVLIATLDGQMQTDRRPLSRLSVQLVSVRDGNTQSGFSSRSSRAGIDWYDNDKIASLAAEVVDQVNVLFDARQPPEGDMPVVLAAGAGGIVLHEAVGHYLEADVDGNASWLSKTGSQVAGKSVNVVDDARIDFERGAMNVDDEGTTSRRNLLIESGNLRTCLHDTVTARQAGLDSTGSARRESFMHAPMPRMTCTSLESGEHSRDEIVDSIDHGIVAETFSAVESRPGDQAFSVRVRHGWLIEKGKISAPIKDATISGSGAEFLRAISMVADDAVFDASGWTCSKNGQSVPVSLGMPTTLVSSMRVRNGAA